MDGAQSPPPPPPPPPPPHGHNPKSSSGLPPGNYDIFIIPPHSAGSGFLYLPSLRPQTNSFVAGVACTLICVFIWNALAPTVQAWWKTVSSSGGGVGVGVLVLAVGFAGWAFGTQIPLHQANPSSGGSKPRGERARHDGPPPGGFPGTGMPPHAGYNGGPPPNEGQGYRPQPGGYGPYTNANGSYSRQHSGAYTYSQPHNPPPWEDPDPFAQYAKHKARTQPPRSEPDSERPNPRPRAYSNASANWQKAREETKRREEERRQAEAEKKRQEEEKKAKEDAERAARAAAEKLKWEQMRAREREQREREARERIAREHLAKEKERLEKERKEKEEKERLEREAKERLEKEEREKAEREARVRAARERIEKAKSERSAPVYGVGERTNPYAREDGTPSITPTTTRQSPMPTPPPPPPPSSEPAAKHYEKPSAKSYAGTSTAESFRPYDTPPRTPKHMPSQSSFYSSEYSSASSAASQSTVPTTAPPSQRGPYTTTDPDKVVIRGVYQFTDSFPKPVSTLISGEGGITDGLILRITTEGMFVDDDVKGMPLRQWDVKAWTLKGIESTTESKTPTGSSAAQPPQKQLHVVRASIRDAEGKKYVFVVPAAEDWKVAQGLERLRKGPLVRSCGLTAMPAAETARLLGMLGYV